MPELFSFFVILLAGLTFSGVLGRLHFPWVVTLILGGIVVGPHGLGIFYPTGTMEFLGEVGLVFLMFMAGIESHVPDFKEIEKSVLLIAFFNGLLPFIAGCLFGLYLGLSNFSALLIGVVFISSSIAVVVPSLEINGLLNTKVGKSILGATILEDVLSLLLLSVLLQSFSQVTSLPLPLFYLILILSLFLLRYFITYVRDITRDLFHFKGQNRQDIHQRELMSILAILVGTVVFFELLGLHPIIAGFFAGFVLSESIASEFTLVKLRAIGYGIFIPVFFVMVGARTDIGSFLRAHEFVFMTVTIVTLLVASKFIGGFIGARLAGFSSQQGVLVGVSTVPQLSTMLAIVYSASSYGLLAPSVVTALVILSIVTTFMSPFLVELAASSNAIKKRK